MRQEDSPSFFLPFFPPSLHPSLLPPSFKKRKSPLEKQSGICETERHRKKDHNPGSTQETITIIFLQPVYCQVFKIFMSLGLKAGALRVLGGYRSLTSGEHGQFSELDVSYGSDSQIDFHLAWKVRTMALPPTSPFLPTALRDQQHPRSLVMLLSCI